MMEATMAVAAQPQELYSEPEFDGEDMGAGGSGMQGVVVDPEPYVSTQFYTFNRASHQLMVQCVLAGRYALPEEIKLATPPAILSSWRSVWKDRHEDTAYQTGWKRIQDKLQAQVDDHGELLYFKSNPQQFVPYIDQWQDIVQGFHADADLRHLGLKDTIERIKQVWTVGAKFYGIPEAYVRMCVSACPVCNSDGDPNGLHKRRRFEYTESMELLAKDVPQRLQQLAAKYKVILCIRQKYIRYKPFLAEVKDYCCHRAGEPNVKKSGKKKNSKFTSSRCGCGFRIRAIVPITNYSYKDKTFTYQEEGSATFKLFAIHTGHDPTPQESAGMVINQLIDSSNMTEVSGMLLEKEAEEAHATAQRKIRELRRELACMEAKVGGLPFEPLNNLGHELQNAGMRLRGILGMEPPKEPQYGVWEDGIPTTKDKDATMVIEELTAAASSVHTESLQAEFDTGSFEESVPQLQGRRSSSNGGPPRKIKVGSSSSRSMPVHEDESNNTLNDNGGSTAMDYGPDKWYLDQPPEDDELSHGGYAMA